MLLPFSVGLSMGDPIVVSGGVDTVEFNGCPDGWDIEST